jgi:hypothetical protein
MLGVASAARVNVRHRSPRHFILKGRDARHSPFQDSDRRADGTDLNEPFCFSRFYLVTFKREPKRNTQEQTQWIR